jgi:glutamate synthase (NADPH) large chain
MVAEYFPGMPSRISGIGITGLQKQAERSTPGWKSAARACCRSAASTRRGGGREPCLGGAGDAHAAGRLRPRRLQALEAVFQGDAARPPIHLRDLLDFKPTGEPVPIEQVESITSIRKRFVTPGMSLGALSPEAHKTLNVAMNRIGAKSRRARAARTRRTTSPSRTATTRAPRSSRWRRAGSA